MEQSLYLLPLGPRESSYDPLESRNISIDGARALSVAAENCWAAIRAHDLKNFGLYVRQSFEAQIAMFPEMINQTICDLIERYDGKALGWKLSGAGGGGYLILVSDRPIENTFRINIRRAIE